MAILLGFGDWQEMMMGQLGIIEIMFGGENVGSLTARTDGAQTLSVDLGPVAAAAGAI